MVKCKDCGLLAGRSVKDNATVIEVDEFVRSKGFQIYSGQAHFARLFCYANSEAFPPNIVYLNTQNNISRHGVDIPSALEDEIECTNHMGWLRGRSPQQHDEMELIRKIKEEHQRQRDEDIARQDRYEDRIERRFKTNLLVQLLLSIVAAAAVLIGSKLLPFWELPAP